MFFTVWTSLSVCLGEDRIEFRSCGVSSLDAEWLSWVMICGSLYWMFEFYWEPWWVLRRCPMVSWVRTYWLSSESWTSEPSLSRGSGRRRVPYFFRKALVFSCEIFEYICLKRFCSAEIVAAPASSGDFPTCPPCGIELSRLSISQTNSNTLKNSSRVRPTPQVPF
jgi:hypothetical protein